MVHKAFVFFILLVGLQPVYAQKAERLPLGINTEFEEREPILSPDGKTLFFWRRENPDNQGGVLDPGDIWFSNADGAGYWQPPERPGPPLNSHGHDFVWGVSPTMDTLWMNQVPPGVKANGLAYSVRTPDGYWRAPQDAIIRDFTYQGTYKDYFLSRDHIMMIPNEEETGHGGTDIYVCFPISSTEWSRPVNLGSVINTAGDEDAPFLAADGKTLYFNSNGHGGFGDHDVFVSYRMDDTWRNWTAPKNLGAPINTRGYDFDFVLSHNEKTALWCSEYGTVGSNDIFQMDLGACTVDIYPAGNHTRCKGDIMILEAGFIPNDHNAYYRWFKDGREIPGATTRRLRVRESGDYQVLRKTKHCESRSDLKQIRFVDPPQASIISPSDVICLDDSVLIEAPSATAKKYQWQKNGLDIPGAIRPYYWVKTPGEYQVKVYHGECTNHSEPIQLQRLSPPGIFTSADTANGILPILPRWLWTNKIPFQKGEHYLQDLVANPKGETFVLSTLYKRGRYYDQVTGFFNNGLYRVSFPERQMENLTQRHIDIDHNGDILVGAKWPLITKYLTDGRVAWQLDEEVPHISGMTTDPLGNVIVMGRFKERLVIGPRVLNAPKRGGLYLCKFNPNGELIWAKSFGVDGGDSRYQSGNSLHSDCEGNLYISGGLDLVASFQGKVVKASLRDENYFLAKFDPDARIVWTKHLKTGRTRQRTMDMHTDCEGNSFLSINRQLWRFDRNGNMKWSGKLLGPEGATTQETRIQSAEGDLYISGLTDKGDFFVTKLNRLNKQVILWQDRGAEIRPGDLPIIGGAEGAVFISGISSSNNYPGIQFDLTSKSKSFIMKYARPDYAYKREPVSVCPGDFAQLFTQNRAGVQYQWFRDGKALRGEESFSIRVDQPGTYQVMVGTSYCEQISEGQVVIQCGDDPMSAPLQTTSLASIEPLIPDSEPDNDHVQANPDVPIGPANDPPPMPEPKNLDVKTDARGTPQRLKNRRVKTQEEIVIRNREATIYVWDHAAADQDTVSININGNWLVQEYGLKKRKKEFQYSFAPGNNYIMLYAHNLGAQPPNTASIMVDDGERKQTLQLRSNLRNCGMLKVRVE